MTPTERIMLKRAYVLIRDGHSNRICFALQEVADHDGRLIASRACRKLRHYIMDQLGDDGLLDTWQYARGIQKPLAEIRRDRLNWIKWMLGEL